MNIANFITSLRILLTPLFVYLYWSQDPRLQVYGILVFILASLTDWFDGYYARRFNIVTRLGQFLDPLADKVLNLSATIMFAVKLYVFWWIVIVIAARDLSVTFFRLYALSRNQPVVTSALAKYKTALNMILIFIIMVE
ncbi:MAG: CDP-diacylglycerol--glycerol-3-phosphate 3-phosphatidyltransferase, partial [Calditrichaeota bacterium]|nr:CDP-diacylglycerol--glycerol-3-phosphate 3-phosphatidyltransferase [Calditrichota bacterium]